MKAGQILFAVFQWLGYAEKLIEIVDFNGEKAVLCIGLFQI